MNYQFIEQYKQEFPIVIMCRVLAVSERGFYAWRKRPASPRQREDAQLIEEIRQEFRAHQGRYGSPRLHAELRDRGRSIARKRVARLTRQAELCAKRKRRRALTTQQAPSHPLAPNLFNREFTAKEQVGHRYDLHTNDAGVSVSGRDFGSLFTNGGRVVDVRQL